MSFLFAPTADGLEWPHSPFLQSYISEADEDGDIYNLPIQGSANAISVGNSEFSSFFPDTWFDQAQFEAPVQAESSLALTQGILFKIREISPEWGLTAKSTKVESMSCKPLLILILHYQYFLMKWILLLMFFPLLV